MILIIALTVLIRFCKNWTDSSQAVQGSGYQFASVRNSSVRQFCELSLNSCQIQWKGSLLFSNKVLKLIHLIIMKLWKFSWNHKEMNLDQGTRWKQELLDYDNLQRSFWYYSHDQHWKKLFKIVLKHEKFKSNCQFFAKIVGPQGNNEDWRILLKSFLRRLKCEKQKRDCW